MIQTIKHWDEQLLLLINGSNSPFLDEFFYLISDKWIWIPFYAILLWLVYKHFGRKTIQVLLAIALMIALSDQLASGLIKNWVMRYRPCHHLFIGPQLHLVHDTCGGQYGFVSSHAANTFALAIYLGFIFKDRFKWALPVLLFWAMLVSYSRIYLGVHYPLDILGGAIVGAFSAFVVTRAFEIYNRRKSKVEIK